MEPIKLETYAGQHINDVCEKAIALANEKQCHVEFDFNGVTVECAPGAVIGDLLQQRDDKSAVLAAKETAKRRDWEDSDEGKAELQRQREAQEKRESERATAFANIAEKATWGDEPGWQLCVTNNADDYGACCVRYAETWARLMEGAMAKGATLKDIADAMSHHADTEGITGLMYGCAVSMLSQCWAHGEELRRWHNKSTQLGTEGDTANESGGVLNPALLSIG